VADLAQRLAPAFDEGAKCAFAGAVADEALVIFEFLPCPASAGATSAWSAMQVTREIAPAR
jgi:hypothetical protein